MVAVVEIIVCCICCRVTECWCALCIVIYILLNAPPPLWSVLREILSLSLTHTNRPSTAVQRTDRGEIRDFSPPGNTTTTNNNDEQHQPHHHHHHKNREHQQRTACVCVHVGVRVQIAAVYQV